MFNRVVLSGGAVPAMAFFGCLQYLEHVGLLSGVDTFVGSSAGSVVGFMIVLGFGPCEACNFFMTNGVGNHTLTELSVLEAVFGQTTCFETLGFDDGNRWIQFLEDALHEKLGCRDITFSDLAKATGRVFVVCVTNLTLVRREYLSVDTSPCMSVILAVRMSLSVPILYVPVVYQGHLYVDGSVLDNIPVASSTCSKGSPPTTLALCIRSETSDPSHVECDLPSPLQYLALLVGAVMCHAQNNNGNGPTQPEITCIRIDIPSSMASTCCFDITSFAFDVSQVKIDDLMLRGYAAARNGIEPMLIQSFT